MPTRRLVLRRSVVVLSLLGGCARVAPEGDYQDAARFVTERTGADETRMPRCPLKRRRM